MIVMGDDHRHHYDDHDNDDDKITIFMGTVYIENKTFHTNQQLRF